MWHLPQHVCRFPTARRLPRQVLKPLNLFTRCRSRAAPAAALAAASCCAAAAPGRHRPKMPPAAAAAPASCPALRRRTGRATFVGRSGRRRLPRPAHYLPQPACCCRCWRRRCAGPRPVWRRCSARRSASRRRRRLHCRKLYHRRIFYCPAPAALRPLRHPQPAAAPAATPQRTRRAARPGSRWYP